jgi:hypothetical protein
MIVPAVMFLLVSGIVSEGNAQKGKTSYRAAATTVVLDNDPNGTELLIRSDEYNGTGQATYTTVNGKGAARSPSTARSPRTGSGCSV